MPYGGASPQLAVSSVGISPRRPSQDRRLSLWSAIGPFGEFTLPNMWAFNSVLISLHERTEDISWIIC